MRSSRELQTDGRELIVHLAEDLHENRIELTTRLLHHLLDGPFMAPRLLVRASRGQGVIDISNG
jgi:hypothetical protein